MSQDYYARDNITRNNRSSLVLQKIKLESARNGFDFQGALVFNKIPLHIRQINSIVLFKRALKQVLDEMN